MTYACHHEEEAHKMMQRYAHELVLRRSEQTGRLVEVFRAMRKDGQGLSLHQETMIRAALEL